jgi:hypothetical protein
MAAQTMTSPAVSPTVFPRTVVVIDRELPKGLAANAAAVLAMTFGVHRPELIGAAFHDAAGTAHPGLYPTGMPILGAERGELAPLAAVARERGELLVVDFPAPGQQTTDYGAFCAAVASAGELPYLAVLISGPPKLVRSLTGQFALLR